MKKKFCIFAFILLLGLAAGGGVASGASDNAADPVVLRINQQEIRQSAIVQAMKILAARDGEKNQEKLYNQAVNDIIAQQLSFEWAVEKKLDRDENINQQINNLAKQSAVDLANYKKEMMIAAWRSQLIVPNKSDKEWRATYQSFLNARAQPVLYRPAIIVVSSEAEAVNIIKQLKSGASFASLAKKYSLNKSAQGGDMGFVSAEQLPPSLALVVASLNKNEFTNAPVKSQGLVHVIKLLDKKTGNAPSFDKSKEGLILLEREKIAREKILQRANQSNIVLIDKNNKETPVTFQRPQNEPEKNDEQ